MEKAKNAERLPSFFESITVFLLATLIILYGIVGLKLSPHMPVFIALIVVVAFGFYLRYSWDVIEKALFDGIQMGLMPIFIMLAIGMIIGSWIACGAIPYIIYLGVQMFSPQWFLVSALLACCLMSMATGSSWTTAGTIGVAFMGIGYALGIPPALTAGAIVSGAVFGDKQSPLSETTNFAPVCAGTTLFEHVRSMLWTTLPAVIIAAIMFIFFGFKYASGTVDLEQINVLKTTLESSFKMNPLLLLLPGILIVLVVKKIPAIPGIAIAAILGMLTAIFYQGVGVADIMNYMHYGYVADTGVDEVNAILSKGGLSSMLWTISLMFFVLPMGGVLERLGVLAVILDKLSSITQKVFGLIAATLGSVYVLNILTGDTYFPQLLTGRTFGPAYDKLNIDRKVLSRSLEDAGTVGTWFIPWSECGMFASATLGVSVLAYSPYYFFGILTPIFSLILAATGIGIFRTFNKEAGKTDNRKVV